MEAPLCKFCGHRHWGIQHFSEKPLPPKKQYEDELKPFPKKEKGKLFDHECLWCGTTFKGKASRAFCSDYCRLAAWRNNKMDHHVPGFKTELTDIPAYGTPPIQTKKKSQPSWFSTRIFVFQRDHFRCRYCGKSASDNIVLHVDHIIPKSKGGSSHPDNLVTACMECNLSKHDTILSVNPFIEFTTA